MRKNATRYCAGLLITGCARADVYCSKQISGGSTRETITHRFLRFSGWAGKKTVDAAKICGGAENVVKQETQRHS